MLLLFVGAPLALVGVAGDRIYLFVFGVALLVIALGLPAREGQSLKEKGRGLLRHLPGIGWLRSGVGSEDARGD